jgi:hypothetical protein
MLPGMVKRSVATALWFLAGWSTGALIAFTLGLPGWIAPITALASAVLIALDPAHVLWPRASTSPRWPLSIQPASRHEAS